MAAQRQNGAGAVSGDFELAGYVAGMIRGEEMFSPVLDPLDRPAGHPRGERNEEILRIEFATHPEATADVVLDHADRALDHAELLCQDAPVGKRHLGRTVDG